MNNKDKLKQLMMDILLLEENEFNYELQKNEIETWDSLGVVSVAVGIQETFGYHLTPDQAMNITSIPDIIQVLESNGIKIND